MSLPFVFRLALPCLFELFFKGFYTAAVVGCVAANSTVGGLMLAQVLATQLHRATAPRSLPFLLYLGLGFSLLLLTSLFRQLPLALFLLPSSPLVVGLLAQPSRFCFPALLLLPFRLSLFCCQSFSLALLFFLSLSFLFSCLLFAHAFLLGQAGNPWTAVDDLSAATKLNAKVTLTGTAHITIL